MKNLKDIFTEAGGQFLINEMAMTDKMKHIKAFVFDWDGVFTDASKDQDMQSRFNEADSMGTNMLRFSFYLKHKQIPHVAIISGEKNLAAFKFVDRERFHASYSKAANKIDAANHLCKTYGLKLKEVAFVFDDVLDLSLAQACGLRIFIPRKNNPLFNQYIIQHHLADYVTAGTCGQYAVREACELMMGLAGNFDETISQRTEFSEKYSAYLHLRRATTPVYYTWEDGNLKEVTAY